MKKIYLLATLGILTLGSCASQSGWNCSKRYCEADTHHKVTHNQPAKQVNT